MLSRYLLITVIVLGVGGAYAAEDAAASKVRERVARMFPDEKVVSITPAPVAGVYEVLLGASLFYISADGRYALRGDLIDLDERENVSARRRAEARKQAFADLDPDELIEFAPPTAARRATLYVYTDVDCGYCRKLHTEVPALNKAGIAVEYLAFPRAGLNSESFEKIAAVWCSPDRQRAMTAAKSGQNVSAPSCDNPVARQFELGQAMGVTGTPAVYTKDGAELGGYIPAERLIKMLAEGKI